MKKKCVYCEKEYETTSAVKMYCSDLCQRRQNAKPATYTYKGKDMTVRELMEYAKPGISENMVRNRLKRGISAWRAVGGGNRPAALSEEERERKAAKYRAKRLKWWFEMKKKYNIVWNI